jgi:NADH:ubiquinone oxidoreductase subunit
MVCLAHHQIDGLPDEALPPPARFLKARPNLTGTAAAYRPTGALERGGRRQAASGDYQAWTPD